MSLTCEKCHKYLAPLRITEKGLLCMECGTDVPNAQTFHSIEELLNDMEYPYFKAVQLPDGDGTFAVYKVMRDDEQIVCTIPRWHDDGKLTAKLIEGVLNTLPEEMKNKIGINTNTDDERPSIELA